MAVASYLQFLVATGPTIVERNGKREGQKKGREGGKKGKESSHIR